MKSTHIFYSIPKLLLVAGISLVSHQSLLAQNVGIGNTNPSYKVDVSGRMRLRGGTNENFSSGLWLTGAGADSLTNKFFWGMASDTSSGFYTELNNNGWTFLVDGQNGRVGIRNRFPGYPLSFADNAGDKISLYRDGSNFYGLGIGNATMQLMTPHSTSDIVFGYGRSAAFTENMRIKGNGRVGIGTANPNATIEAKSNMTGIPILRLTGVNEAYQDFYPLGISGGRYGWLGFSASEPDKFFLYNDRNGDISFITGGGERLTLKSNGNVGIGINNSNAPLQFSNGAGNRKIVLYDVNNNDHQFYGLGINSGILRYQTAGSDADHIFFSGITATTSQELMRIKGNGNVGIGISDPAYKLDVGARMRIRATSGFSAGHWLNNEANTTSPAFIGMQADNQVGFFGSGAAGWGFLMNTQTGALTIGGSTGLTGHVLTSNGTANSPSWVAAGVIIKTAFSGITSNTTLTGTTLENLDNSTFTINVSVPSRIELQYKTATFKSCFAGNCATKWSFGVYQNGVSVSSYIIDGVSYGNSRRVEFSNSTVGPDYFDVEPGSYTFSFKAQNLFNDPTISQFVVYSTTIAR
jgi:hypothetical protein